MTQKQADQVKTKKCVKSKNLEKQIDPKTNYKISYKNTNEWSWTDNVQPNIKLNINTITEIPANTI